MVAAKGFFLFLALVLTEIMTAAPQAQDSGYADIDEQQLERRNVVSSASSHLPLTTSSPFVILSVTIITIRATPVRITKQMQYVTSNSPIMTICPSAGQALPSQPSFPVSGLPTASVNDTNATLPSSGILPWNPDLAAKLSFPCQIANVSTCSIFWEPIPTPIYHTTLSPLADPLITATNCQEPVTFSSQLGYALASDTVGTLTTYYVAS